ncbi:MAG: transposase [Bacteriovoracaceae bacterium]|nr:transposase [Bacteriovoracaceae bacterium]
MLTIDKFHPNIQLFINYFSNAQLSYQKLGDSLGISKEAVRKRLAKAEEYLLGYDNEALIAQLNIDRELSHQDELKRKDGLIKRLQLQLVLYSAQIYILTCFKEHVGRIFPALKLTRFKAYQKFQLLTLLRKYLQFGGIKKEFGKAIGRSMGTILGWEDRFRENGFSGLHDKTTRPKNFGNKISLSVKKYLVALFIRYPHWTDYQYHKHLRFSAERSYYISLPTIQKIRKMYLTKSDIEKERIKKRWCFATGTNAWTVDFTSIIKTANYQLQLLTVSDCHSRFLFKTALLLETSTELVMDHLKELFIKHGRPTIIKADNGPEFRTECSDSLREFSIYLLNNPVYYGQFNGAHERIHRTLKNYITKFERHRNITQLVEEINKFEDEYNYKMPHEYLEGRTPAQELFSNKTFIPEKSEIVTPYEKDGELRFKFKNRNNQAARLSLPVIEDKNCS